MCHISGFIFSTVPVLGLEISVWIYLTKNFVEVLWPNKLSWFAIRKFCFAYFINVMWYVCKNKIFFVIPIVNY